MGQLIITPDSKMMKKMEAAWKSTFYDGQTVSVTNPQFYKQRFFDALSTKIFPAFPRGKSIIKKRKTPTPSAKASLASLNSSSRVSLGATTAASLGYPASASNMAPSALTLPPRSSLTASSLGLKRNSSKWSNNSFKIKTSGETNVQSPSLLVTADANATSEVEAKTSLGISDYPADGATSEATQPSTATATTTSK